MARRTGLLALLLLTATSAQAQMPISLNDALAAALANNPALAAARSNEDRATSEEQVTRGAWFPRLTVTESLQRGDQPVFAFGALLSARQFTAADFAVARLNMPGATNLFTTRVGVQQLVFDGGRASGARAEASARRDSTSATADEAATSLAIAVVRTYGQLVNAEAAGRALDGAIAAAVEDLARANRRRDAGTVTDADVLAVSVHVSTMRQKRLQLAADNAAASAALNRLMGTPVETPIVVTTGQPDWALPDSAATSEALDGLFAEAEAARPELRRADADVRGAEAAVRQATSVWWPQAAVQAGLEWNGVTAGDRSRAWVVGGEVRWSLSLSGADRARSAAARSAVTAAQLQRDDVRAAIRADVFTSLRQLEAARARVSVGVESVAQATERARVVRNRYDVGLASMTDVLAASSALLDAEAQRTAAAVDVLNAGAQVLRALGRQVWK